MTGSFAAANRLAGQVASDHHTQTTAGTRDCFVDCGLSPPAGAGRLGDGHGGELIASLRSEPANYNRYFDASAAADVVALLTQARLVRVNRATDALEPALAESWEASPDGRSQTLKLRKGVTFSDGAPFTSADVLFSFAVAYDAPGSQLAEHHGRRTAARVTAPTRSR